MSKRKHNFLDELIEEIDCVEETITFDERKKKFVF